jgi:hypothetical protein
MTPKRWLAKFNEFAELREKAVRDANRIAFWQDRNVADARTIADLRTELAEARRHAFLADLKADRLSQALTFTTGQVIALRARNDQLEALHRDRNG